MRQNKEIERPSKCNQTATRSSAGRRDAARCPALSAAGSSSLRVRSSHLLAWCGPCLPVAAMGLPLVVYLPPYYAGTLGMPLATVGFIFAVVRLLDIPVDPLIGALMDNTRSRFGQFRPWMVAGGVILMLGVWLMFMAAPGIQPWQAFASLFILYIGFSCVYLAQTAWGSRLSPDYAERARIFGWWTAMNVAGTLMVLLVPPLAGRFVEGATTATGIQAMGWFIIALLPLTVLAAAAIVPEGAAAIVPEGAAATVPQGAAAIAPEGAATIAPEGAATIEGGHGVRLRDLKIVLADRRMLRLLAADLLMSVVPGITGALFLFFFVAAKGTTVAAASTLLLFYFVAGLAAAPLWIRAAARFGKHRAAAAAVLMLGLTQLGVVAVPEGNFALAAISMAIAGIPFAAPAFLLRAMLADLNDAQALDRLDSGGAALDTTGLNFALLTATAKLGYAIPVGLTYPILALIGFNAAPGAANSESAIAGLITLFIVPPLALAALAAIIVWRWPITAEAHALVRQRLNGQPG